MIIVFKKILRGKFLHVLVALTLAAAAALAQYFSVFRLIDLTLYDTAHRFSAFSAAPDILVVDIDERSMAELGAWPWSRQRHADLLAEISKLGIEHIAFDVIFAELNAADIDGDLAFADAIKAHGGVVLPIFIGQPQYQGYPLEIPPASLFYSSEPGLGHIHIDCDGDGICRSVYLREGVGEAFWPHISYALLKQQRYIEDISGARAEAQTEPSPKLIYRDYRNHIAFPSGGHDFNVVSFVDVVDGYFPANKFSGYTAFVGSTAAGNGDVISTPSGELPGVVVNAIIYQQLRDGTLIQEVSSLNSAVALLIIGFLMLMLVSRLSPLAFLLATLVSVGLAYVAMVFALFYLQVWIPIAALVVLMLVYYPMWNWFKLQLALNFLKRQLTRLNIEKHTQRRVFTRPLTKIVSKTYAEPLGVEVVTNTLKELYVVSAALEEQYFIFQKTLARLAEAVLLFNSDGELVLSNDAANKQFVIDSDSQLQDISQQLRILSQRSYKNLLEYSAAVKRGERLGGVEFELVHSQEDEEASDNKTVLLCRAANSSLGSAREGLVSLLILNFSDISSLKRAERSKLDTLNFLSHDLRSPMVSILALVENIRNGRNAEPMHINLEKIKDYAQSNLSYSEAILQLGRAESASWDDFDLVDLHAVVDAAYCAVLDLAKSRDISVRVAREDDDFWVNGNAELLERALQNLLHNAVKYSDSKSQISLTLRSEKSLALISVEDQGVGIDIEELAIVFQRYAQGKSRHKSLGAGLGLYFVSKVMNKHQGSVQVESKLGVGSCFTLTLARAETT